MLEINNGNYHVINHNLFVDVKNPLFKKEKCNYVYQDVTPLITYEEWVKTVKSFSRGKSIRNKHYLKIFEKHSNWDFLFGGKNNKISYNDAFQLFRFLEISPEEEFKEFIDKTIFSLKPNNNWDWKRWNRKLIKINSLFSKFQSKLIYKGFTNNLKHYKLYSKFNIDELKLLLGRIDGRYGGVISINYCHPDKYVNFWKDYRRFNKLKKSNIISLKPGVIPYTLKLPEEPFVIFNNKALETFDTYIDKNGKHKKNGFFNTDSEVFQQFINKPHKFIKNLPVKVVIIGCNDNGISYANFIKIQHKLVKRTKKK